MIVWFYCLVLLLAEGRKPSGFAALPGGSRRSAKISKRYLAPCGSLVLAGHFQIVDVPSRLPAVGSDLIELVNLRFTEQQAAIGVATLGGFRFHLTWQ